MLVNIDISVDKLTEEIIDKFKPSKIILFGSVARGTYKSNSDIDLCIIKDTLNKRELIIEIYTKIDCEIPFDILLYTNEEWQKNVSDSSSFAYKINKTGVYVYG
jgi:predicted nucleotidyltransferase